MQLLAKIICGSRLHGTHNEKSDLDIKGIYLPTIKNMVLGRAEKNIQLKEENMEIFSLQEFLRLAQEGDTHAIEMLHAPKTCILHSSPEFENLVNIRKKFITKKVERFASFSAHMAEKYTMKGDRKTALGHILKIMNGVIENHPDARIRDAYDQLPLGSYASKNENPKISGNDKRIYTVEFYIYAFL